MSTHVTTTVAFRAIPTHHTMTQHMTHMMVSAMEICAAVRRVAAGSTTGLVEMVSRRSWYRMAWWQEGTAVAAAAAVTATAATTEAATTEDAAATSRQHR